MNAIAHPSAGSVSGSKLDNRRMLAALIDLSVVAAGAAVILVAAGVLGGDGDGAGVGAPLAAVVVGWALYYYFACESGGGQTLGKKLMNVRVVRVDGSPVGIRDVAVRTVLRVVDTVVVGLVTMLATGERRGRVGDLVAGTMIVSSDGSPAVTPPAQASAPEAPEATPMSEVPVELAVAEAAAVEAPVAEEPVADAPVMDEPVAAEPTVEPLADEPVVAEPVAEEPKPVALEPVVTEPVVSESAVELSVVDPPALEEVDSDEPVPSADLNGMDVATPSLKELAQDVAAAAGSAQAEPQPETEVNVKPVETVSAMDLIMGDDESEQGQPKQ